MLTTINLCPCAKLFMYLMFGNLVVKQSEMKVQGRLCIQKWVTLTVLTYFTDMEL